MQDREIMNGGKLTVREGQVAAFLNEGRLADTFGPGLYTLQTQNLPILTDLLNWDKAFKSPFKSDIYFFTRREQLNLKWGTTQPITIRDKDLGAIRVRAFGGYSFHIGEIAPFREHIVGILDAVRVEGVEPQLRAAITTAVATALGGDGIAFLDLAGNQAALSEALKAAVTASLAQWGLEIGSFFVESLSLPEEVQQHLDKASSMRALGDLGQYAKFQAAEAIETAAAQPGGLAGLGAGAVAGLAVGQTMMGALSAPAASAAPAEDPFALIEKLHRLLTLGAISQDEFDAKKAALMAKIG